MRRALPAKSHLKNSAITAAVLLVSLAIGFVFDTLGFEEINIYTVFILGIILVAMLTASRLYSIIASIIGVLMFNFLFASPRMSFKAVNFGQPLDFIIVFIVSLLVSTLAYKTERMAFRTKTLLTTDQLFLQASGTQQIVSITAGQLQQLLGRPLVFYMAQGDSLGSPQFFGEPLPGNEWDWDAAVWAFTHSEETGSRTSQFSHANYVYLAIRTPDRTLGVAGAAAGERPLSDLEKSLMRSLLNECALTLERDFYDRKRQETAVQMKHEKLRADLLRSISHDLRTPLTSISGNASLLSEQKERLTEEQKQKLVLDIRDDAKWLLGTVENLLSVTRIEDGRMSIKLQPEMISEIVAEAVAYVAKHDRDHILRVEQEDDMLMAHVDARLIMQVLLNLIDNAVKYTPKGSVILVCIQRKENMIAVSVADNGPGIPDEHKPRLFEMFYTTSLGSIDGRRGLGLGLALCKAIVNAHGGELSVDDHPPHGAVFTFTLKEERIELP